jgi:uncharacterized protein YerC
MEDHLPISKFKSRKEWENYVWKELLTNLATEHSPRGIQKFTQTLLTTTEKNKIIYRAAAISLLQQGKNYREIGNILWLSSSTISAIRKSVQSSEHYISARTRKKMKEKRKKPLTKEEFKALEIQAWLEGLFTLPAPPIPHPRFRKKRHR